MEIVFVTAIVLCFLACLWLYIYCIVHVHRDKTLKIKERANWITLIVIFPFVGSLIYLFNRRRKGQLADLI